MAQHSVDIDVKRNKQFSPQKMPKITRKKTRKEQKPPFRYKPEYSLQENILFVGEGNFSFSLAIAEKLSGAYNMTCTSFDSLEELSSKYPETMEILQTLEDYEATILHQIDATKLDKYSAIKKKRFDKIIFNFPHVGLGIKDRDRNIRANQELISEFMLSAFNLLTERGEILITVKTGDPYDEWDVRKLAKAANLKCTRSFIFNPSDYDGYTHRRTIGFQEGISDPSNNEILKNPPRTYIFQIEK